MAGTARFALLAVMGALVGCSGSSYNVEYHEHHGRRPMPPPGPVVAAPPAVEVNMFYGELAPHGHWVTVGGYGQCWVPARVAGGWRPYTVGRWVYTEYGWTWMSDEPWGWATYHYGRWMIAPGYGWVWVPGTVWGPAWVAWRGGGGYMGWAPLPPAGGVDAVVVSEAHVHAIAPSAFTFVQVQFMAESHPHRHAVAHERNVTIINQTTNITKIEVVNQKIVNRSVSVEEVERISKKKVERRSVREVSSAKEAKESRELAIVKPPVRVPRPATPVKTGPQPQPIQPPAKPVPPVVQPKTPPPATVQPIPKTPPTNVKPAKPVGPVAQPIPKTPPTNVQPVKPPTVQPMPKTPPTVVHPVKPVDASAEAKSKLIVSHYAKLRQQMQERQAGELAKPPAGTNVAQLKQKHLAERNELENRYQMDLRNLKTPNGKANK